MNQSINKVACTKQPEYQVVDPSTLGRPTHLLPVFTAQLREDLAEELRILLNRRYRAHFQVRSISMQPMDSLIMPGRWTKYLSKSGRIDCAMDRSIVLGALAYRYGIAANRAVAVPSLDGQAETETEKRLSSMLALQFVNTLIARVTSDSSEARANRSQRHEFDEIVPSAPPRDAWLIEAVIEENALGISGNLCFTLCETWMDRLLAKLSPLRTKRKANYAHALPLPTRLEFRLVAQLLEMDMPLGNLLDIEVGDIIPVRLDNANILIDNSRLFTATVAEHKGKLCLTSFEDAD